MNKTAIKNYAIWARVQLIESAKQRAYEYEITENGENNPNLEAIGGRLLSKIEKEQRQQLINQIRQKGYTQVMEEAAYTWFNRFIALRFMEVNGYLPSKVRVFTDENNAFKPEIMKEAMSIELDGLNRQLVLELIDKQDNETLYKTLLIAQCNALNTPLPYMFERISNWTELLFPANLLRRDSVIGTMISSIPEEDWTDAVQIIGWLYQYYNTELKDETFALLKKNVKITKERIPAATQLFTPDWIVRYMVENSLGRLWYEGHKDFDKSGWKYYLDEAEQEPEVELQLQTIRAEYAQIKPEDIKIIDPCMGSGHILVYAFDVLMQIYTAVGWSERDAAKSIIENNLFGLDIDDRAGQLAYFSILMKARKYNRRILIGDVHPNVLSIQDSNWMTDDFINYVAGKDMKMKADLTLLRKTFFDAKECGSLLSVPAIDHSTINERIDSLRMSEGENLLVVQYHEQAVECLVQLVKQSELLSQKYDVIVTNPPYMGSSGMSNKLSQYTKENYPDSKNDLFSVFIECGFNLLKEYGFESMITMESWMFLSSFEKLRINLLKEKTIIGLVHMPYLGKGGTSLGINFGTDMAVIRNVRISRYTGTYDRIAYYETDEDGVPAQFPVVNEYYKHAQQDTFFKIPGAPIAYWVSAKFIKVFEGENIYTHADVQEGLKTGDNERFIRNWYEVDFTNTSMCDMPNAKWVFHTKGGDYRKWYGNQISVLNYNCNGSELKKFPGASLTGSDNYFKENISYSRITSAKTAFRYTASGSIPNMAGLALYPHDDFLYMLGWLNTSIVCDMLSITNPTINFPPGTIGRLPYHIHNELKETVSSVVRGNIELSKKDWDSFELSWDFARHPLVRNTNLISEAFKQWSLEALQRFVQLKTNEEELNRIFTDINNLQGEMLPDVDEKDVTVRKADLERDIRSLISYAVGCMFGRYNLDEDGLAFAGGEWKPDAYKIYPVDKDGILPITDDEYFDDDIVGLFVNWVRTVYGEETLEANLKYIADALGGKGTPREVIRNYFLNDFYADHLKIYQKRPIYWLFSSGKKNGFKCLIYMHRYQPDLLARIRTDYVHEQQERYRTQLTLLEDSLQTAGASERVKLNKQITKIKDQALELQKYEEKIHHLADQMIPIDLDDGVKVNYAKFQDVLEKIK